MKLTLKRAMEIMDERGGNIDLHDTNVTSLPDGLVVPGSMYLYNTGIARLPENLVVGGNLDLYNTSIRVLPEGLIVGGNLDLSCTSILGLPYNLTVGGDLDLRRTKITKLPENLTVGGSLYLNNFKIINLPESLKVGGSISGGFWDNACHKLRNVEYVPGKYLYVDGFLLHVKSVIRKKIYTIYVGEIEGRYVVNVGNYYSFCGNICEGIADLLFQKAKSQGIMKYEGLNKDSIVTCEEAIALYRVITGASRYGVGRFLSKNGALNSEYSIAEVIELTTGEYGSKAFAEYFGV